MRITMIAPWRQILYGVYMNVIFICNFHDWGVFLTRDCLTLNTSSHVIVSYQPSSEKDHSTINSRVKFKLESWSKVITQLSLVFIWKLLHEEKCSFSLINSWKWWLWILLIFWFIEDIQSQMCQDMLKLELHMLSDRIKLILIYFH